MYYILRRPMSASAVSPAAWIRPAFNIVRRMSRLANFVRRQVDESRSNSPDTCQRAAPGVGASRSACLSLPSSVPFIRVSGVCSSCPPCSHPFKHLLIHIIWTLMKPSQLEMSLLAKLPTELIMKILYLLDWRSLIACCQVRSIEVLASR